MTKSITVYTSNTCAYCGMVKQYLQLKGQTYQEVNIEEQPDRQAEMIELTGQMNVPVTVVEDTAGKKQVAIGYNLGKLSAALS